MIGSSDGLTYEDRIDYLSNKPIEVEKEGEKGAPVTVKSSISSSPMGKEGSQKASDTAPFESTDVSRRAGNPEPNDNIKLMNETLKYWGQRRSDPGVNWGGVDDFRERFGDWGDTVIPGTPVEHTPAGHHGISGAVVASTDSTMPLQATEKAAGELKSNPGIQLAMMDDPNRKTVIDFPVGRSGGGEGGAGGRKGIDKPAEVIKSPEALTPGERRLYETFKGDLHGFLGSKPLVERGWNPTEAKNVLNRLAAEHKQANPNAGKQISDPYMEAVQEQAWNRMARESHLPEYRHLDENVLKILRSDEGWNPRNKDFLGIMGHKLNELVKQKLGDTAFEALKRSNPVDITPIK